MLVALGTRPESEYHWYAKLLASEQKSVLSVNYIAPNDTKWHDLRAVAKAIPGLHHLPKLKAEIKNEIAEAKDDIGLQSTFRALRRNEGLGYMREDQVFCTVEQWLEVEGVEAMPNGVTVWGIDLSNSIDMSSVACYWPVTGRLEVLGGFCHEPDLKARAKKLQLDYEIIKEMVAEGSLHLCGQHILDIAELLELAHRRWGLPTTIVTDGWREKELLETIEKIGMPVHLEFRRHTKDSAADYRALVRAFRSGYLRPIPSVMLRTALAHTLVLTDLRGNSWISKRRPKTNSRLLHGFDDPMLATQHAVSLGEELRQPAPAIHITDL